MSLVEIDEDSLERAGRLESAGRRPRGEACRRLMLSRWVRPAKTVEGEEPLRCGGGQKACRLGFGFGLHDANLKRLSTSEPSPRRSWAGDLPHMRGTKFRLPSVQQYLHSICSTGNGHPRVRRYGVHSVRSNSPNSPNIITRGWDISYLASTSRTVTGGTNGLLPLAALRRRVGLRAPGRRRDLVSRGNVCRFPSVVICQTSGLGRWVSLEPRACGTTQDVLAPASRQRCGSPVLPWSQLQMRGGQEAERGNDVLAHIHR